MTDWTTIATAGIAAGAAIGGGWLGYLGARYQGKADLERLKVEHAEAHLQHRQGVYHDFLDSVHRFHQDAGGIEPFETPEDYQQWAREYEHRLTAVNLFGTEAAWKAAQDLNRAVLKTMADPEHYGDKHEWEFLASWDAAIAAMRPDTAPKD